MGGSEPRFRILDAPAIAASSMASYVRLTQIEPDLPIRYRTPADVGRLVQLEEAHWYAGASSGIVSVSEYDSGSSWYGCLSSPASGIPGRRIPSFRMRASSVVRAIPSLSAAPRGPPITQFVPRSATRICTRCASTNVTAGPDSSRRNPDLHSSSTGPAVLMTERSMQFCNSRIFPGQW